MLFYLPLESYQERYTSQLAAPKTGWLERNWIKAKIPYHRMDGYDVTATQINSGVVLDAPRRCKYAMSQIDQLIRLAELEQINDGDKIYFDDFWHPGIESLPYCFQIMGINPSMYAFLYAQS